MPDQRGFVQLHQLQVPRRVVDQAHGLGLVGYGPLQLFPGVGRQLDSGEHVLDQGQEERFVLVDQLAQVHVPEVNEFFSSRSAWKTRREFYLNTLMTVVSSVSFGLLLFWAPRVLSTDRMFLRPKS